MRLFLLGRRGGVTHWLEDCAAAWRADGHQVAVAFVRDPRLPSRLEDALFSNEVGAPRAAAIARFARRFGPDLMLAVGGFHAPRSALERLAALPGRAPLVGWVGDAFGEAARASADLYDLVAYTDSGLVARHAEGDFRSGRLFLPHAVDPAAAALAGRRDPGMVFVGHPTSHRRDVLAAMTAPITVHGPGWSADGWHIAHARRLSAKMVMSIYGRRRAVLNIRNELHVLAGLNQRNFAPCLAGAALLTDRQADLERCFEPGRDVLAWGDVDELNAGHARLIADADFAAALGAAGRRRVLADHTFAKRLETLRRAL